MATVGHGLQHRDEILVASDGQRRPYRITEVEHPRAVVVMQDGTLSRAEYFDLMAARLAEQGITSYSVPARQQGAADFTQHQSDLAAAVAIARLENPGLRPTVMGVSFGAMVALHWNCRSNREQLPVVAMAPVVATSLQYLGPHDLGKVLAGLVSRRAAERTVPSPKGARVELTTNPRSPEWRPMDQAGEIRLSPDDGDLTVPVSLYDDNLRMLADITFRGCRRGGPLLLVQAGEDRSRASGAPGQGGDRVGSNTAARWWTRVLRAPTIDRVTIRGAAHDLSQESNHPELVKLLIDRALGSPSAQTRGSARRLA